MKHIIISTIYLLFLFCVSKFIFDPVYLYYELPWLDIPMHIMGGFGVAALALSLFSYKKIKVSYLRLFFVYLFIAISWELYEYFFNPIFLTTEYDWIDTISDLINGFIGMNLVYLFIKKK